MKLPFSFGIQLVYRILLPGSIVALGAFPLLVKYQWIFVAGYSTFLAFTLITLFVGWLFVLFDMHIYMLLEGRRYWPKWLFKWGVERQQKRVEKLDKTLSQAEDEQKSPQTSDIDKRLARRIELETSVKLRWFPVNKDGKFYATHPTALGNILQAYESYPSDIYGLQAMFYWPRLWLLISEEERREIDGQQAMVDGAIYSTVALWLASLLLIFDGYCVDAKNYWLALVLMLASLLVYKGSLYSHAQFGALFKAVFDVHHANMPVDEWVSTITEELADFTGPGEIDLKSTRGRHMNIYRWLNNRRIKVGSEVVPAATLKKKE